MSKKPDPKRFEPEISMPEKLMQVAGVQKENHSYPNEPEMLDLPDPQFADELPNIGLGKAKMVYGEPSIIGSFSNKSGSKRKPITTSGSAMSGYGPSNPVRNYVPKMTECSGSDFSPEDLESVKSAIKVVKVDGVTTVVGLVVDVSDTRNNQIVSIRCSGGQPFVGFCYDHAQDSYLVNGITVLDLGRFDFTLKMYLPGIEEWSQNVPIPNEILQKHFSAAQRRIIDECRNSYPSPKYEIKFIQMVG